jgi:acyl carrier protein
MEARGAEVNYAQVNVSCESELDSFLQEYSRTKPDCPIRGLVHAAGVWRDQSLEQMEDSVLEEVLKPKVQGSWLLHRLLSHSELDFFVLFSSFSSILPPFGQANYAAANIFLDVLSQYRRQLGKPALSINWGPWSEVGFASTKVGDTAHRQLESLGVRRITPSQGVSFLGSLLKSSQTPVGVISLDVNRVVKTDPSLRNSPFLAELNDESTHPTGGAAPIPGGGGKMQEAPDALSRILTEIVGKVLHSNPPGPPPDTALMRLGLDSLMAIQIKNHLLIETGIDVPLVKFLEGATITSLAQYLAVHSRLQQLKPDQDASSEGEEVSL